MLNEIEKGQLSIDTVQCFTTGDGSLSRFPGLIKMVIAERVWERRIHHGRLIELPNLLALVTEKPIRGWGQDPSKIEAVIRDDAEALTLWREEMKPEVTNQYSPNDNVTRPRTPTGNSLSYTLTRLKKQAPALYQKVVEKALTANEAAIEAGFRIRTISVPLDPVRAAAILARHFSTEQIEVLLHELRR